MPVIQISDAADPRLSDYRDLNDVALRRILEPEGGLYIAESEKVLRRALQAGHRPRSVLSQSKWLERCEALLEEYSATDIPIYEVSAECSEQLAGFPIHRGVMAAMHRPELLPFREIIAGAKRVMVLENIIDHTNVGAIFRSAAGLGIDAVLIASECADPLYRRSIRVSMGGVFQVPWAKFPSWSELKEALQNENITLAALALRPEAISLRDFAAQYSDRAVALMMGAEGDGLSRKAIAEADCTVIIPMRAGVDSLNVAAASAVAIWALGDS